MTASLDAFLGQVKSLASADVRLRELSRNLFDKFLSNQQIGLDKFLAPVTRRRRSWGLSGVNKPN
jgi:hypothetical protein